MKILEHTINQLCLAAWLSAFSISMTGCSLLFGVSDECNSDADCAAKGPGLVCEQRLCVSTGQNNSDSNTNGNTDSDTSGNTDSNTNGNTDSDTNGNTDSGTGSESDSETGTGAPQTGMDLLGGPCLALHGMDDPSDPLPKDAIIIGAILPLTGELALAGGYFDHVTTLAYSEINQVGGIQGRRILMITCDSGTTPQGAKAAAEHLRDLGVQAVLGPFSSELVISVYFDVLRDAGMMVVSAGANAPIMDQVSAEGLIWSTSLPAAREAKATAEHLLHNTWAKVAVIHRDDTWGGSMFDAFQEDYCSGGTVDCNDANQFMTRSYATSDLVTSLSVVAADLAAWQPDVIVGFAYIEDSITFFMIAEAMNKGGASLKSMLWNSSIASDLLFAQFPPDAIPSVLCQISGTVQQIPSGNVHDSFLIRYNQMWPNEPEVPYTAAFYDASYMLAYAYAAASRSKANLYPTGAQIAAAMQRLSSGTSIKAGTTDWLKGVTALRASDTSTIDYVGASGDVNFPAGTGSIISPVDAFRLNVGTMSVESLGVIYSENDVYTAPDYSGVVDTGCTNIQP